jgi:hypothetical protein
VDLGLIICTKQWTAILRYLQQISVKFVEILRCEREFLVSGSGSRRGAHMCMSCVISRLVK